MKKTLASLILGATILAGCQSPQVTPDGRIIHYEITPTPSGKATQRLAPGAVDPSSMRITVEQIGGQNYTVFESSDGQRYLLEKTKDGKDQLVPYDVEHKIIK